MGNYRVTRLNFYPRIKVSQELEVFNSRAYSTKPDNETPLPPSQSIFRLTIIEFTSMTSQTRSSVNPETRSPSLLITDYDSWDDSFSSTPFSLR